MGSVAGEWSLRLDSLTAPRPGESTIPEVSEILSIDVVPFSLRLWSKRYPCRRHHNMPFLLLVPSSLLCPEIEAHDKENDA